MAERAGGKRRRAERSESPAEIPYKLTRSLTRRRNNASGDAHQWESSTTDTASTVRNKLTIGLDLGTTRSGSAWHLSHTPPNGNVALEEVHSVSNYEFDPSWTPEKREDFPTEVQYDPATFQKFQQLYGDQHSSRKAQALFGFEIDHVTKDAGSPGHHARIPPLKLVKLLLSESRATSKIQIGLKADIESLISDGIVESEDAVLVHIFLYMLDHTYAQVQTQDAILSQVEQVEFALGLPPAWTARGRRRELNALQEAIGLSRWARFQCQNNIFAITETEAAATYLLHGTNKFNHLDTAAVIDIGGGTTDANVYRVRMGKYGQLRLMKEMTTATGIVYGAGYLNVALKERASLLLKNEQYLIHAGLTLESIIQSNVVREFELRLKRNVNFDSAIYSKMSFYIQGLKPNAREKRFTENYLNLNSDDVKAIFKPFTDQIVKLIREVLTKCQGAQVDLKKIILVGGGSESIPIVRAIQTVLQEHAPRTLLLHNADKHSRLAGFASNAVACGCVLRAIDKANGPQRVLGTSIALLRHEPYDEDLDLHRHIRREEQALVIPPNPRWIRKSENGQTYIFDLVHILVQKGQLVDPLLNVCVFESLFVFPADETEWDCTEEILASDNNTHTDYPLSHSRNKGVDTIGTVTYNVKHLADAARQKRGPLEWIRPSNGRSEHYRIQLELCIRIQGLRLTAELRLPGEATAGAEAVMSIASVFRPGTA